MRKRTVIFGILLGELWKNCVSKPGDFWAHIVTNHPLGPLGPVCNQPLNDLRVMAMYHQIPALLKFHEAPKQISEITICFLNPMTSACWYNYLTSRESSLEQRGKMVPIFQGSPWCPAQRLWCQPDARGCSPPWPIHRGSGARGSLRFHPTLWQ